MGRVVYVIVLVVGAVAYLVSSRPSAGAREGEPAGLISRAVKTERTFILTGDRERALRAARRLMTAR